jgi:hypothetical protein
MVMILITDPSEREIVLRALEPVVDSGQLHIEFPEEIKPWQLFRLFRQFDREQICLLHVNGYDSEDVFAYGIGPDTHSVSFRVWKGIIGQVPEGKMCFLSSGTSNRMVDQMLDLGFDACFSADTFQSEGDQLKSIWTGCTAIWAMEEASEKPKPMPGSPLTLSRSRWPS